MKLNLPRIVWLRWAGPENDVDRLLLVGASNNQEAKRITTTEGGLLEKVLGDISDEVGPVWDGAYTYIEYDNAHWDEEDGIPEVDRWDVIVIGPEDQLFWQLITGSIRDAELEFWYAYKSRTPDFGDGRLAEELRRWCIANPADAREFLNWTQATWDREDRYVSRIVGDPELSASIEAAEMAASIPHPVVATKERGHGKAL
ncbi:MAG: hypothetical protein ABS92_01675 [Thiobacillus sp. SCN 63-374]|nr:MAG: hypothetical protein ABS92_01675 [Thiobacillus sp. SCN 63-374]